MGRDWFISHWGKVWDFWEMFGEDMGEALVNPLVSIREFIFGGYQEDLSHRLCDFDVATPIIGQDDFLD